jgi:hypothetical protein
VASNDQASRIGSLSALRNLTVIERPGPASTPLGVIAIAFTGMLVAKLGARVLRDVGTVPHPMTTWAPAMPDGSSALERFLSDSKEILPAGVPLATGSYLLTDDRSVANAWPDDRVVLIAPLAGSDRIQSELTTMAASGLLDIVCDPGKPPLPLPGHQVAYATGLAAFTGLVAAYRADLAKGSATSVQADPVEVSTWLNWKNRLSSVSGNRQTGRDRREEWRAVRCKDGYIAVIFRDRDIPDLAKLLRNDRLNATEFRKERHRLENLDEFHHIVANALKDREKEEILKEAGELGLQFSAVLSPADMFDDPQMKYREFFVRRGDASMPRLPILWNART